MYIEDLVKEATEINMKNEALQKLWPQMFIELVRDAVIEIRNKNSYMKLCLQQITDQKQKWLLVTIEIFSFMFLMVKNMWVKKMLKQQQNFSFKLERLASKHLLPTVLVVKGQEGKNKRENSFPMYVDQTTFGN